MDLKIFSITLAIFLAITSCTTIRTTSEAFRTGKVLAPGQLECTASSIMFVHVPLLGQIQAAYGLGAGWEISGGFGIHGFVLDGSGGNDTADNQSGSADNTLIGPEIYVSKNLVNYKDTLYLGATVGADINIVPKIDATVLAGDW